MHATLLESWVMPAKTQKLSTITCYAMKAADKRILYQLVKGLSFSVPLTWRDAPDSGAVNIVLVNVDTPAGKHYIATQTRHHRLIAYSLQKFTSAEMPCISKPIRVREFLNCINAVLQPTHLPQHIALQDPH